MLICDIDLDSPSNGDIWELGNWKREKKNNRESDGNTNKYREQVVRYSSGLQIFCRIKNNIELTVDI